MNITPTFPRILFPLPDERHRGYSFRGAIEFSEAGIEHGLYLVTTTATKKGGSAWATASLIFAPDRREELLARIAEAYVGFGA